MHRRPKKQHRPHPPPTPAYTEREARSQRRTAVRNPGMTRVLATPELLECVLLHLDMRTLLVSAQRACRTWRELITTSPALQEALFFKPEGLCGTDTAKTRRRKGQGNDVVMPTDETVDRTDGEEEQKNVVVVRKNPLLASVFPAWFEDYVRPMDSSSNPGAVMSSVSRIPRREQFASQPFAAAADRVLRYRRASWRRMLVQQPPARHVGEWQRVRERQLANGGLSRVRKASMRFLESGLRMGRLYDVTSEEVVRAAKRSAGNVRQYVLWGPEGARRELDVSSAPAPHQTALSVGLGLIACAPREGEGKKVLDGLVTAADITILVYDKGLRFHQPMESINEFCRKFICGPHSPRFTGKSWQEQPKGEQLWYWEK